MCRNSTVSSDSHLEIGHDQRHLDCFFFVFFFRDSLTVFIYFKYLFIYLLILGFVGSSFLCEGFL